MNCSAYLRHIEKSSWCRNMSLLPEVEVVRVVLSESLYDSYCQWYLLVLSVLN
jgi:hypothetical protein